MIKHQTGKRIFLINLRLPLRSSVQYLFAFPSFCSTNGEAEKAGASHIGPKTDRLG